MTLPVLPLQCSVQIRRGKSRQRAQTGYKNMKENDELLKDQAPAELEIDNEEISLEDADKISGGPGYGWTGS